jgi:hypothetical protein
MPSRFCCHRSPNFMGAIHRLDKNTPQVDYAQEVWAFFI